MKQKNDSHPGVQELCRKLKEQLEVLNHTLNENENPAEMQLRRDELMEQLKRQLSDLS